MTKNSRRSNAPSNYTVSHYYDRRLYKQDIAGSTVHARMLAKQGIITQDDASAILHGLEEIRDEIESGTFPWQDKLEDIHMNIESRLQEKIGSAAGRLHTGRSRNDQIATDMRLYCKEAIKEIQDHLRNLRTTLLNMAEAHQHVILPGYTHLQRGQAVLLAHHLLAYEEMLHRDTERFLDCYHRTDVLPLGSGALAGSPYDLDRDWVAQELGFLSISRNSMDAVSDRDFVAEFQSCSALCMMHCSRLSEELILWSSSEFGFIGLANEYTTGSSLMPQKSNPDLAELARGKTGRVYGHLMSILTVLKGLPLTYNRDLQEDKEGLFDTYDTLCSTLSAIRGMVSSMQIREEVMRTAASDPALLATDLADYLVKKGMPFRQAHGVVADLWKYSQENQKHLAKLTLEEYQRFSELFDKSIYKVSVDSSIEARNISGGTAPTQVSTALREARRRLAVKE
jgi:argininosuccinate lyase